MTDPAKEGQIDFPDSVVALLEGRLGFPHKGFPEEVNPKLKSTAFIATRLAGAEPVDLSCTSRFWVDSDMRWFALIFLCGDLWF